MHNNSTSPQNELSQQQIDSALLKLAALLKDDPPKPEKQKVNRQVLIGINDDSRSYISQQPSYNTENKLTTQQVNQLVGRMYDKYQQTQDKIQKMRQDHRPSPLRLNQKSEEIIKQKMENGEYQPLHERAKLIHMEKQEKIKQHERQKSQEEMMSIKIKSTESKSIGRFLEKMEYWQSQKHQTLQSQQQEKIERELEGVTFHPQINKKSEKIVLQQSLDSHVLDRFQKSQVNKQIKNQQLLGEELKKMPFQPKLNQKSISITSKKTHPQHNYIKSYNYYLESEQPNLPEQRAIESTIVKKKQDEKVRTNYFESKNNQKKPSITQQNKSGAKRNIKSLTPDKHQTLNKHNTSLFERSPTPLRNNKTLTNVQEIKYNPNLKFLLTLAQQSKDYKPLF